MSPARLHRERAAALAAHLTLSGSTTGEGGTPVITTPAIAASADPVAAQIQLRLTHDLRRLKEIKSIARKVEAKREMLPEYRAWCDGLMAAAKASGEGVRDEVLPTIMVWCIDAEDWTRALELAAHVLRYRLPLPGRYQRDAPSLIAEEIATAAIKLQAAGKPFPLAVLEEVEQLVADDDMHDEIRAKLMKALGTEHARASDDASGAEIGTHQAAALAALLRAQALHDRVGVKTDIRRLEKAVAASAASAATSDPTLPTTPEHQ